MKKLKLLVLSSALIMGLTACGGGAGGSKDTTDSATSAPAVNYATLANEAITNISAGFDKWSSTGIAVDQTLVKESKVTHDGKEYTFAITYTISDAAKAFLEVSADGATLIVKADAEQHALKEAVVAHASIEGKEYASKGFNVKILATSVLAISKIYDCKTGDSVVTRGYVTKILVNGNILVADGESAITVYTNKKWEAAVVGNVVEIAGKVDIYNGLYELKPDTITKVTSSTVAKPVDLVLDGTFDAKSAKNQGRIVKAEGAYLSNITAAEKESKSGQKYNQIDATIVVGTKDQGYATVSIHVEDRKASEGVFETWGFDATAANKLGPNAPKVGQGISIEGVSDWYNQAQVTDAKLTFKGEYKGDFGGDIKPAPAAEKKTVGEILALGEETVTDRVFEVTGILEGLKAGDKHGNGYLTDPTTKETVMIYGLTGTADKGIAWDGAAFSFSNPKDADTSLAGVTNGMEITMKCTYTYFSYTKTPEIMGNLLSHKASTATYTATAASADDPAATITLSKTEGIAYGEEITVSATSSKAGYVVDTIKVIDAQGNKTTVQDGKFNATCVNTVEVTFRDSAAVVNNVTLNPDVFGLPASGYKSGSFKTGTTEWTYKEFMRSDAGALQMRINKKDSSLYSNVHNTTAFEKAIKNVVITFNKDYTKDVVCVASGTSVVTSATNVVDHNAVVDNVYTYTPTNNTDTFFNLSHHATTGGAAYITSVVINFVD